MLNLSDNNIPGMSDTLEFVRQCRRKGDFLARVLALCILASSPCQAAGLQWPAITEPPTSSYVPGKWVWAELFTEDARAAAQFYGKVFGWSFQAFPAGKVNPLAIETLGRARLPTGGLRSKSWNEFAAPGAPLLDFVFTVCDNADGEVCPVWPGQPMTARWGVEDPAKARRNRQTAGLNS